MDKRGELEFGEPHPASVNAKIYISSFSIAKLQIILESFSSCAIEGNRLAEICAETLHRLLEGKPVSDRYILGLAWTIKYIQNEEK